MINNVFNSIWHFSWHFSWHFFFCFILFHSENFERNNRSGKNKAKLSCTCMWITHIWLGRFIWYGCWTRFHFISFLLSFSLTYTLTFQFEIVSHYLLFRKMKPISITGFVAFDILTRLTFFFSPPFVSMIFVHIKWCVIGLDSFIYFGAHTDAIVNVWMNLDDSIYKFYLKNNHWTSQCEKRPKGWFIFCIFCFCFVSFDFKRKKERTKKGKGRCDVVSFIRISKNHKLLTKWNGNFFI